MLWPGTELMVPRRLKIAPSMDTGPVAARSTSCPPAAALFTSATKVEPAASVSAAVALICPVPARLGLTVPPVWRDQFAHDRARSAQRRAALDEHRRRGRGRSQRHAAGVAGASQVDIRILRDQDRTGGVERQCPEVHRIARLVAQVDRRAAETGVIRSPSACAAAAFVMPAVELSCNVPAVLIPTSKHRGVLAHASGTRRMDGQRAELHRYRRIGSPVGSPPR